MSTAKIISIGALCLLLCFLFLYAERPVKAQEVEMDQELAQRRGISGSLAGGEEEEDDGKGVTKVQAMIGIGSILIMFAVVKFW
jgi:hypothetical protein